MSSSGHQKRASEQSALLERKRKITEQVKSRFSRYGDDILKVILAFALSPRRMPMLLQGLGHRVSAELEDQLEGVSAFVATNGPIAFLKRLEEITGRRIVPRHSTRSAQPKRAFASSTNEIITICCGITTPRT